jgi:hypothetical protein
VGCWGAAGPWLLYVPGCWWPLCASAPSSRAGCRPTAASAVGAAASRAPPAATCGRASGPPPARMPFCLPTATCVPLSRRCMPQQYARHHPRASPPEGRSCRRPCPCRCRVPTAARPPESVARLRTWRQWAALRDLAPRLGVPVCRHFARRWSGVPKFSLWAPRTGAPCGARGMF